MIDLTSRFSSALQTAANFVGKFSEKKHIPATDRALAFSFGDPEPVLNTSDWSWLNAYPSSSAGYYIPPFDFSGFARLMDANPYHGPILVKKKNLILSCLESKLIPALDLERMVLDLVVTENLYAEKTYNRLGGFYGLRHSPALYTYRGLEKTANEAPHYVKVLPFSELPFLQAADNTTVYEPGEIIHLLGNPDLTQSIYAKPSYIGVIQSVLLSEQAILFRRKYYINGAHLGYILVANDANFSETTEKEIETQIKNSKGAGNFRSLFLSVTSRNGNREPIKVIPIGQAATNDEFEKVSLITEAAMCSAHQIPPVVACIIPENVGGFGNVKEALDFYYWTGVMPVLNKLLQLNESTGREVIKLRKPDWLTSPLV